MHETKKIKAAYTPQNYNLFTRMLKGSPYEIELSNYTAKFSAPGLRINLSTNHFSNRTFAAYSKLKSDIKNHTAPAINEANVNYYEIKAFPDNFYCQSAENTDITAAYLTVMLRAGYISQETYDYIIKLPKMERLVCFGMLASRREIYTIDRAGRVLKCADKISEHSPFFFWAADNVYRIMHEIKTHIVPDTFLFSWVDGIYYIEQRENGKTPAVIHSYLKDVYGLDSKHKKLSDFTVQARPEIYKLQFNENGEKKTFAVPRPQQYNKLKLIQSLLNLNKK